MCDYILHPRTATITLGRGPPRFKHSKPQDESVRHVLGEWTPQGRPATRGNATGTLGRHFRGEHGTSRAIAHTWATHGSLPTVCSEIVCLCTFPGRPERGKIATKACRAAVLRKADSGSNRPAASVNSVGAPPCTRVGRGTRDLSAETKGGYGTGRQSHGSSFGQPPAGRGRPRHTLTKRSPCSRYAPDAQKACAPSTAAKAT